jgi:hypothetical protein
MPQRPRSHQIETESRLAFAGSLPSSWVYRDVNPDYGLDGLVELFAESGGATGSLFFVQLKATDLHDSKKALRIRLPLSTCAYYETLLVPVLLVLFYGRERRLYAKWASDLTTRSTRRQPSGSVAISFDSGDVWDASRIAGVRRHLMGLKRAAKAGQRDARVRRYYELRRRVKLWSKAKPSTAVSKQLTAGDRVFHPVFGYGSVEQASDLYSFVQFDQEDHARKFLPGAFWEFERPIISRRTRGRPSNRGRDILSSKIVIQTEMLPRPQEAT